MVSSSNEAGEDRDTTVTVIDQLVDVLQRCVG